ncbi:hypothetical protein O3P69_002138 [Scylla paramamosain]|uniref:Uncharacterized protein n=1 Tax=Scylla paramamosain TaxID=85552 RepID=A0AAW0V513_SCYPA
MSWETIAAWTRTSIMWRSSKHGIQMAWRPRKSRAGRGRKRLAGWDCTEGEVQRVTSLQFSRGTVPSCRGQVVWSYCSMCHEGRVQGGTELLLCCYVESAARQIDSHSASSRLLQWHLRICCKSVPKETKTRGNALFGNRGPGVALTGGSAEGRRGGRTPLNDAKNHNDQRHEPAGDRSLTPRFPRAAPAAAPHSSGKQ